MDDPVIRNNEENVSVSSEKSDLAPSKPNKLFLKLKISKTLKRCGQHICPVCSKGFTTGKALGGHIRIHMKGSKNDRHRRISKLQPRNIHRASKNLILPKARDIGAVDQPLNDQEDDKVSCCVCNKDFRSMKSLFGHMRNHPERGWRGIRPPPNSDKNSCCSSVSDQDNEALEEVVDQISFATEKGDLLESLPRWTNTAKRCGKYFTSDIENNEIHEAAYCLMKLARGGDSFDLVGCQRKYSPIDKQLSIDKTRSWGLANKASSEEEKKRSEGKGKAKLKTDQSDQEKSVPSECKRGDSYRPDEEKKMGKLLAKELNLVRERENKMKVVKYADAAEIMENNSWFDQFQKLFPMKPAEEKGNPSIMEEGRYKGRIFPSSQTFGFYSKNPSGHGRLFEAPVNETAPPAQGKHLYSKTLFPKTAEASDHQVCSPKILDFDLNEPYVPLDGEATGT